MPHTYEEIRNVILDVLAGREQTTHGHHQYTGLALGVAEVFERRAGVKHRLGTPYLDPQDEDVTLEVFWNLFREGVVTLGMNSANPQFPFFRVSHFGKKLLEDQTAYFFLDVSSFEKLILDAVPNIDETTMVYLKEAMQAFLAGCILSSSVMLGVASEHTFDLLVATAVSNPKYEKTFAPVTKERMALKRFNCFKSIVDTKLAATLPQDIREDLDTDFAGILATIRTCRNESGHPTGKIVARDKAYMLLNLFPTYCKKVYQLRDWLAE